MHYVQQNGQRLFEDRDIPVIEYRNGRKVDRKIKQPIFSTGEVSFRGGNYHVEDKYLTRTVFLSNFGRASGVNPNKICISFPERSEKKGRRIYVP